MDDAAEAHRAAVVSALLGVLGSAIGMVGFWRISGLWLRSVQSLAFLINGAALWWLYARLPPFSRSRSNAIFLLVLVPTAVMTWMIDDARAAHSAYWVPYEPNKLSALTLAIIAPPGWRIGMVAILLFIGSALLHHLMLAEALRARMSAGEPFGVIAYGVFALVILGFKQRGYTLRDELEQARAEKVALERVARLSMALRDLANTPVQTLELVRQRLLSVDPQLRIQTERMGRALERLRRLNDILAPYQSAVVWDGELTSVEREIRRTKPRGSPSPSRRRN
ncbi:MAG TPA: hypothetical protein VLC06_22830 [Polyangia bacterium]|jgi:hypothetical protein|nr:hypothetical protein [Polyangia bacterium]